MPQQALRSSTRGLGWAGRSLADLKDGCAPVLGSTDSPFGSRPLSVGSGIESARSQTRWGLHLAGVPRDWCLGLVAIDRGEQEVLPVNGLREATSRRERPPDGLKLLARAARVSNGLFNTCKRATSTRNNWSQNPPYHT